MIVQVSRDTGQVIFIGRVSDEDVSLKREINKPTVCTIRGLVLRDMFNEMRTSDGYGQELS